MTERITPSGTPLTDKAKQMKEEKMHRDYPGGEKSGRDGAPAPTSKADVEGGTYKQPGDDPGSKSHT